MKGRTMSALDNQVGGSHYKKLGIQPVEYMHANGIPFMEGCAIKYLTRWRDKGGVADLEKARHFIDLLIELETRKTAEPSHAPAVEKRATQCAHSYVPDHGVDRWVCIRCGDTGE
jgi:hypothetical protein